MDSSQFTLNEQSLSVIEQFGDHMPGGFFIYRADDTEELLYANRARRQIFGCDSLEDFKAFSGYTFRGMVHPEDYERVAAAIRDQRCETRMEYRIVRRDGEARWVDDYRHYVESEAYQGLYYVFISDITDKRRSPSAWSRPPPGPRTSATTSSYSRTTATA